jgi:hypothetical protein
MKTADIRYFGVGSLLPTNNHKLKTDYCGETACGFALPAVFFRSPADKARAHKL